MTRISPLLSVRYGEGGIAVTEGKKARKITGEMFLVLLVSALLAVGCMLFLYEYRYKALDWALSKNFVVDGRDDFIRRVSQEAPKYALEPTVQDTDREMFDQEHLPFLFEKRDTYIGFSLYNNETGKYVTGYLPEILSDSFWGSWFFAGTPLFTNQGERVETNVQFQDCAATMIVESYRVIKIFPVYLGLCIAFCLLIFLTPVLAFVHQRMKYLGEVRSEMLVMAQGDLDHHMCIKGNDEITSLAQELDHLRQALKENIEKERQSHRANQELIRAMSHDLRTPLTTLYGYLEILGHSKGNSGKYPEYIRRCIAKTQEIRDMSDKMFEYALVFDAQDEVDRQRLSLEQIWSELWEQVEYLRCQGFHAEMPGDCVDGWFLGNAFLIKRLLGNLFSNIQRYGEKSVPVEIRVEAIGSAEVGSSTEAASGAGVDNGSRVQCGAQVSCIRLTLYNCVRMERAAMGSGVGLKSAERIALLHDGMLTWEEKEGYFRASLILPLVRE